jgi:hypothetical protein
LTQVTKAVELNASSTVFVTRIADSLRELLAIEPWRLADAATVSCLLIPFGWRE